MSVLIRSNWPLRAGLTLIMALGCGQSDRNAPSEQGYSLQKLVAPAVSDPAPSLTKVEIERGSQEMISSMRVILHLTTASEYELKSGSGRCRLRIDGASYAKTPREISSGWSKASTLRIRRQARALVVDVGTDPSVVCRAFHLVAPARIVVDFDAPEVKSDRPIIVLDPGHGGDDYGARAQDLRESDLALDIARRVGGILERAKPDALVLQTRTDDRFIALERRVAFANAVGAVAFVSIHLNSADEQVRRGGVSTFVLDTSGSTQARKLAAHENGTSLSGVSELQTLLAGLHREDQLRESLKLAEFVQQGVLVGARQTLPRIYDRGVRKALFAVLVGARMPAVLVEGSFLTQPEEAAALARQNYRQDIARGIASGVLRYLASL